MRDFLKDSAIYRQFLADEGNGISYRNLSLSGVMIREIFAVDPDMTEDGTVILYIFPSSVSCTDENGKTAPLPYPKYGDLVQLHPGTERERTLRVAEAGYFSGGGLGHVRLKLR